MTVRLSTLANGFRVVTHAMPSVESVSVGVWVGVGTRHEKAAVSGVAHLLEHMAFKGTQRRSAIEIAGEIENVGGHLNAYTSRESTVYYARVLKEDVALAVDLLGDILKNATFDDDELTRERAVVLQEIGQAHDTPDDLVFDRFQLTAFPDQPLGRPVLGDIDVVRTMPRQSIIDYMQNHYASDRMVLAAAGHVDHDALVALAEDEFGGLRSNGSLTPEPARYRGGDNREQRDLEQLHLVMGFPGISYGDEDFYAASIMSTIFGGGMSSRLFQEIREKRGLVYSIYCFSSYYADSGLFGIYAGTGAGEAEELAQVLCTEIQRLPDSVLESEIVRARNQLKAGTLMSLESTGGRCEQLGQQTLIFGAPIPLDEQVRRIEAVDGAAVARVANRIFAGPLSVATVGPSGQFPQFDDLATLLTP
jgi:predicted Zn-dependent peptidase